MKRSLLLTICAAALVSCGAQVPTKGYHLEFNVNGWRDTTAYLGYYYGETTYVKDTAHVDMNGHFVFDGNEPLVNGVYFLVLEKTRMFDFVMGPDQTFSMTTDTTNFVTHMKVAGDADNKLFFENMIYNMERNKEVEPYVKVLQDSTLHDDGKRDEARQAFTDVNKKVIAYQKEVISEAPNSMTARLLKASQPIDVPDPPQDTSGKIDSSFQYKYYRKHFFDNFDLSDEALLHLPKPVYSDKVKEYLNKLFVPDPDTIAQAIEGMVAKAKSNQETYKYLVWTCMVTYENPEIMGLDKVFVTLYDKYFASGEMDYWVNDKMKANLKEYADRLRLSLVGQVAPDLILQDGAGVLRSMYKVPNKYVIIYFFDPDCGHCRKETPVLVSFHNHTQHDVGVFAVSTDSSLTKMKNYVTEMGMQKFTTVCYYYSAVGHYTKLYDAATTPTLYVLDRQHKIIGKKVPSEKLEEFLDDYEAVQKRRAHLQSP